jgi:transposase
MSHLTPDQKLTIVRLSLHERKPTRTVASQMNCSRREVYQVLRQFRSGDSFERKRGSGPPTAMDDTMTWALEKAIRKKRNATSAQLQELMCKETGRRVSARTIRRARRELRYHPVHASLKPQLTEKHMTLRLQFCRAHRNDSARNWVFMDEMGIGIDIHRNVYWIKPGEARPVHEVPSSNIRLNVWGAVWYEGRSALYISRQNFDSRHYVEVLQRNLLPLLPLPRKHFIQDRATWHWTPAVQQWCIQNEIPLVQDFPPKSPDLNAIEFVWGWIKHTVATAHPVDYDTLEAALRTAWDSLEQQTICHFIDHIETVIEEITAAGGSRLFAENKIATGGHSH